ncbi:hypothetical protein GDO81_000868 [Engystomops pustulosus]|uniref:Chemokine interleukin-8-like domain-containing protein n=1 Tax=Engystomops pustulosus TaxID=76066 RepID=A0AAV7D7X2_ENGPU|nr:hypothetical protein GDO81_000868 [Engystomops pustulosus]
MCCNNAAHRSQTETFSSLLLCCFSVTGSRAFHCHVTCCEPGKCRLLCTAGLSTVRGGFPACHGSALPFTTRPKGLWESRFVRRRCKCLKKTNELIHPEHFKNIIVLPETQNCRRKKIIIQLKNGYTVCVNTNAEWVGVEKQSEKVKKNRNFGY